MNLLGVSFVIAVALILAIAVFFILCRRYEEGYLGNIALGLLVVIPCAIILWEVHQRTWVRADPVVEWLVIGLVAVIARHAYRFVMFHWAGKFGWKRPQDAPAILAKG